MSSLIRIIYLLGIRNVLLKTQLCLTVDQFTLTLKLNNTTLIIELQQIFNVRALYYGNNTRGCDFQRGLKYFDVDFGFDAFVIQAFALRV